jgi:hypothetical protein
MEATAFVPLPLLESQPLFGERGRDWGMEGGSMYPASKQRSRMRSREGFIQTVLSKKRGHSKDQTRVRILARTRTPAS